MPYAVTRQSYWPDGQLAVEVAGGGLDYCNPDALVAKYPGEFEEFLDPRKAVKTAIEICRKWRADLKGTRQGWPTVRVGYTGGFTIPFEEGTFAHARAWAEKEWESLAKCTRCGNPLRDEGQSDRPPDVAGAERFCSRTCANQRYRELTSMSLG
jgi:hypothetical protein